MTSLHVSMVEVEVELGYMLELELALSACARAVNWVIWVWVIF